MRAMIAQLVEIKVHRETEAATGARRQRLILEEAARTVEERRDALERFRAWREEREDALFRDVCGRLVQVADLEELKRTIFLMREQERLLADQLREAEAEREAAAAALERARETLRQAQRVVRKYGELRSVLAEEALKDAERAEDLELEDFKSRPAADGDDDDPDGDGPDDDAEVDHEDP